MKMSYMSSKAFLVALSLFLCACTPEEKPDDQGGNPPVEQPGDEPGDKPEDPGDDPGDEPEVKSFNIPSFEELNQGDAKVNSHAGLTSRSSLVKMESTYIEIPAKDLKVNYPNYPRVSVLKDGSYFLTYQAAVGSNNGNGHSTYYAVSKDFINWEYKGVLWKQRFVTNSLGKEDSHDFTNANHIVLSNGDLLVVSSYRSVGSYYKLDGWLDHGIIGKISKDNGQTWGEEFHLFKGPNWESHLIQLPNGDIHCYFAYPRPWISDANSGTALVVSKDGGKTWEPEQGEYPYFVMRSVYWAEKKSQYLASDQMPVGVLLNDSDQFAFAVEVVESWTSSKQMHSVSVVFSPEDGNWKHLPEDHTVKADCQRINDLDGGKDGIGPYLVQFPSGETVLTYTQNGNSKLYYRIGDHKARNWQAVCATSPFPKYGGWSSEAIDTPHTLIMANKYSQDGARGIALAKFALNHDISATQRTPSMDADNSDWANTDEALYLDALGAIANVRCSSDSENVYFLVEVKDNTLSKRDKVTLVASPVAPGNVTGNGALRITLVPDGRSAVSRYNSGKWSSIESIMEMKVALGGTIDDNSDEDEGYILEIRVPKEELTISDGVLVFNPEVYDAASNGTGGLDKVIYINKL